MKKQRIFLHTLILVLAAACFGTAAYGWTKYANVKAKMSIGGNTRTSMRHL